MKSSDVGNETKINPFGFEVDLPVGGLESLQKKN